MDTRSNGLWYLASFHVTGASSSENLYHCQRFSSWQEEPSLHQICANHTLYGLLVILDFWLHTWPTSFNREASMKRKILFQALHDFYRAVFLASGDKLYKFLARYDNSSFFRILNFPLSTNQPTLRMEAVATVHRMLYSWSCWNPRITSTDVRTELQSPSNLE